MKNMKWNKSIALLVSLVLLVCVTIGGTLAYLITSAGPLENVFQPSEVTTKVVETFEHGVKSDVKIQNTGDTTAWIRAAVVVTWQNAAGEVYGQMPVEDTDYTVKWTPPSDQFTADEQWLEGNDGFHYWSHPVPDGENTGILIGSIQPVEGKAPEGYFLCVEILCSGIQSEPTNVVVEAWKLDVNKGISITFDGKYLDKVN